MYKKASLRSKRFRFRFRAEMLFCFSLDYYIIIVGFRNVSNKIQ